MLEVCAGSSLRSARVATLLRPAVWVEGYVGFRWRPCEALDMAGKRSPGLVMMQTPCFLDEPSADAHGEMWHRRDGASAAKRREFNVSTDVWMRVGQP